MYIHNWLEHNSIEKVKDIVMKRLSYTYWSWSWLITIIIIFLQ